MEGNIFSAPIKPFGGTSVVNRMLGKPADEVFGNKIMEVDKNLSPSLYEGKFGEPFAVKALGLGKAYMKYSPGAMENARGVDEFVREEMRKTGMADTQAAYREVLDRIFGIMKISKNTDPTVVLKKMSVLRTKGIKKLRIHGN